MVIGLSRRLQLESNFQCRNRGYDAHHPARRGKEPVCCPDGGPQWCQGISICRGVPTGFSPWRLQVRDAPNNLQRTLCLQCAFSLS